MEVLEGTGDVGRSVGFGQKEMCIRDSRMDVVIDYKGEQFIIELKIWRGNAYHERGEEQLACLLYTSRCV